MADSRYKAEAERLLAVAGVAIDGPYPWDMQVHDERLYARIFAEGTLGFCEAYTDGWWDAERLDETMARILGSGVQHRLPRNLKTARLAIQARWTNRQSKRRAWTVGRQHYDLGNDLFEATFDSRLTGSCGYWRDAADLDAAQDAKLDLVCRKIGLRAGQHVFDIGCGWGAFMGFAAERYGARCAGVTISQEQVRYVAKRYAGMPVEARLMDYRDAIGEYDHVVSMGMFEHVGPKNYRRYFEVVDRVLEGDGFFLLHTIGSNESTNAVDPWMDKYIFRNGALPSMAQIGRGHRGAVYRRGLAQLRRRLRQDPDGLVPEVRRQLGAAEGHLRRALLSHVEVLPTCQRRGVPLPQHPALADRAVQARRAGWVHLGSVEPDRSASTTGPRRPTGGDEGRPVSRHPAMGSAREQAVVFLMRPLCSSAIGALIYAEPRSMGYAGGGA